MLHFHMAAALMSYHKSLNTLRYNVQQEKIAFCHVLQHLFSIARPWDQHKHKSTEFWRSKIQEENAYKESAYMVSLAITIKKNGITSMIPSITRQSVKY